MRTEEELIHTIWDIVRAGQKNQDDSINERLMRSFLRIHRGKQLDVAYRRGATISSECFQELPQIDLRLNGTNYTASLPKIIRLRENYGILLSKDDLTIPVLKPMEFRNASKDRFNKFHPRAKFIGEKLTVHLGLENNCNQLEDTTYSVLNTTVRKLKEEAKTDSVFIEGIAVLVNPDDGLDYDFTNSPYPMPDELIEGLVNSVNAREFNLFLRTRSDETGDSRDNSAEFNTREEV